MPFANFKVPAGTLTAEQKELIGWGIGDHVLTLAMLQGNDGPHSPTGPAPQPAGHP
jgi:hypothetical protein